MLREPDGCLKYKFIVPGSVYSNTLWDWDCWLTDVALSQFVKDDIKEYEIGCVLNCLENMDSKGRIHIFIDGKFSKERYENWGETNIHKPCLAQHAAFIIKSTTMPSGLRLTSKSFANLLIIILTTAATKQDFIFGLMTAL